MMPRRYVGQDGRDEHRTISGLNRVTLQARGLNCCPAGRAESAGCVSLCRRWHRRSLAAIFTIRARPDTHRPTCPPDLPG